MLDKVPHIMTFDECRKLLKVGRNTMLDLLHNKEIEAFRIGNRWKITRDAVIEYMKRK